MDSPKRISRQQLTLEVFVEFTLLNLGNAFIYHMPEKTSDDFKREIVDYVWRLDNADTEVPVEMLRSLIDDPEGATSSFIAPILVSCAYCVRAMKALDDGKRERAWSFMADARYYCGIAVSGKGLEDARVKTIKGTRSQAAKKSAAKRVQKYEPIIEEAYRLAKANRPLKGWTSRRHAVMNIMQLVLDFSIANKDVHTLKEGNIGKTVDKWLSQMPDAESLFRPVKKAA